MMSGYIHPGYAESLSEFGTPHELPNCGGWVLERPIPGYSCRDAMGCYPLFACREWSRLKSDLKVLEGNLVSVSLVTDPFGAYDRAYLRHCFEDVVLPFKEHFVVDLSQQTKMHVSEHHRRYARKALQQIMVERADRPIDHIDDWVKLYEGLVSKHGIRGISTFSRTAFARQLEMPGLVMFRALHEKSTVGILIWYVQGEVGYYHLGASSAHGYGLHASFALFWRAIEYLQERGLKWLDLGGGAGVRNNRRDGLSEFKRGWSTGTRTAYFCGRILNHARYAEIVNAKGLAAADYFPAYRTGEFA